MKKLLLSLLCCLFFSMISKAQMVSCASAALFVGQKTTVCGQVKSTSVDTLGQRSGTMLYMCLPYPNQPITIIIKNSIRSSFPYTPEDWIGKQICVSGLISVFHGHPFIEVKTRTQVVID
jgi:hypothetical protein